MSRGYGTSDILPVHAVQRLLEINEKRMKRISGLKFSRCSLLHSRIILANMLAVSEIQLSGFLFGILTIILFFPLFGKISDSQNLWMNGRRSWSHARSGYEKFRRVTAKPRGLVLFEIETHGEVLLPYIQLFIIANEESTFNVFLQDYRESCEHLHRIARWGNCNYFGHLLVP